MDFTSETGIKIALAIRSVAAWLVALLLFFPILFMLLTSFKTELQAIAVPSIWIFAPTLDNYAHVQERSDYLLYARTRSSPAWCRRSSGC
jgi:sorbitol/mannitol transport system permease protein